MDYEKAYKAVLQTATQWIKDGCTDKEKICLECVFPELRESELTEFEQYIESIMLNRPLDLDDPDFYNYVKDTAKVILETAKKEICKGCTVGLDQYWKGREDARKEYEKPITYHYPTYWPPCYHGGVCTNPFKDCINCPRTGGDIGISTTSGTCKKD